MEKHGSVKKVAKLSENDKRILLAYSNSVFETGCKVSSKVAISKATIEKSRIKLV